MLKKLTLAVGFGAGYVLGAKAGTQRYEQIAAKARELAGMPAVQEVTNNLSQTASTLADTAKTKANDTITSVASPSPGASTSPSTSGPTTGTGSPLPGAPDPDATTGTGFPSSVDLTTGSATSGYDTGAAPIPGTAPLPGTAPIAGAAPSDTV